MPNYRLSLTLTPWGLTPYPTNPDTQDVRIQHAVAAAADHRVRGRHDVPLDPMVHRRVEHDGTITWRVHGDLQDVNAMLVHWRGQEVGHAFTANVTAANPVDDP
jgi:hypothetical protein